MSAGLNDIIVVEVERLKDLLHRANCQKEELKEGTIKIVKVGDPCKPQRILLFIDGRPLKGMLPESESPELFDGLNGRLRYHLQRPVMSDSVTQGEVDDTKEHWADLLGLGY